MYYNQTLPPAPMMNSHTLMNNRPTIEVTGEGTVSAAPDKAVVELGVIMENLSLSAAQKKNAEAMAKVIDALLKLSIPQENIQTFDYRIDMEYNYEEGKQTFRGYKVTHLLQVTINKIDQTGIVIDTAVNNGANSVSNIQFTVAHPEAYYNQALALAVKNGERKALTIASTLGVTLNKFPGKVEEMSPSAVPSPYQAKLFAQAAATPIQPGELKIAASVRSQYFYY
ncbi:SIMPL domain-containing protein [Paenibacillus radicis (ex Xue et al. 2023)]|uniref:SIMPL domain-containing protein n=1 Tax=Paenibacillus radicis (ex Xue et al. 2023) TaxID=2972489 RepID=A0ABT1YCJ6_9BACL|nr:SIMPL domain-containing protein [Paenibacillus radicis (ex Xue et al. 2023)]MCR8630919.1 SIMPL domain-containing protein [Paenibacillus radicis (ex Xue et al. 2023)]